MAVPQGYASILLVTGWSWLYLAPWGCRLDRLLLCVESVQMEEEQEEVQEEEEEEGDDDKVEEEKEVEGQKVEEQEEEVKEKEEVKRSLRAEI